VTRIAYITAGAGGMLCGSCIRDNALVAALQRDGCDALLIPIYTPLRTDEENVAEGRVFFGAVNVYLQQRSQIFTRLPAWLRRLLDNPRLLRWVSASSASVDARELGALALSMLQGELGRQHLELEELAAWLGDELRPDVIHLTNSMLLGLARSLRQAVPSAKIVCSLQGEDIFLLDLVEPYRQQVLDALVERAADCDLFVATSDYCARSMAKLLGVDAAAIRVTGLGVRLDDLGSRVAEPPAEPLRIGFLGRICPEKGLHLLLDAFRELVPVRPRGSLRLEVAGYLGGRDAQYLAQQKARLVEWGIADLVTFHGEIDRQHKAAFLDSLHLFTMPAVYQEPKGLSVLEAMASGVPVVQPAHGAFPELIAATGGGILVEPHDPGALARGLASLLDDPAARRALGESGRTGVRARFSVEAMASATLDAYRSLL
jgi:glycosyltransferase involved in cell wall biosynthesis